MSLDKPPIYIGKDLEAMSFAERYHQWILDEFRPYLHGEVVEVGAGSGNFTSLLADAEIEHLISFEPSENMFQLLTERVEGYGHIEAVNGFFNRESGEYQSRYDAVTYINVLEHIERDLDELQFVREALKPGGSVCIFVPALSWLYSELDKEVGHYRRYHKKQLVSLVKSAGFEIARVKYFDMLGILPWYIVFVLMKQKISGSNVSLYDRYAVPSVRWFESVVTPPIGKNLLLVAKKPIQD
jgi:SAM-dependent methyltransferase